MGDDEGEVIQREAGRAAQLADHGGALVRTSCRRIKLAMASGFPCQPEFALANLSSTMPSGS